MVLMILILTKNTFKILKGFEDNYPRGKLK